MHSVMLGMTLFIFGVGIGCCLHWYFMESSSEKEISLIILLSILFIGSARDIFMKFFDNKPHISSDDASVHDSKKS